MNTLSHVLRLSVLAVLIFACIASVTTADEQLWSEWPIDTWTWVVETGAVDVWILWDQEYIDAVAWMRENGMTKYTRAEEFRWEELVTREQAAKFYSQFAKEILYATMDMAKYCRFGDLWDADPSLKNYILEACLFSLFQGSSGVFSPQEVMTKDQSIAVLMRALLWTFLDESWDVRRWEYYQEAFDAWITKETDMEKFSQPVTRYELALLLYRAAKNLEAE